MVGTLSTIAWHREWQMKAYMTLKPRRTQSISSRLWKTKISHRLYFYAGVISECGFQGFCTGWFAGIGLYQRFWGICSFHLLGWRSIRRLYFLCLPTRLLDPATQKTTIGISTNTYKYVCKIAMRLVRQISSRSIGVPKVGQILGIQFYLGLHLATIFIAYCRK
jgi:hypothetical protein